MSSFPLSTGEVGVKPVPQTPWYVWLGAFAVTSASIGGAWDVAWHRSIGRDTFWTPAHMAIQACGVIAAFICGYLILVDTFGKSEKLKAASVNVLGFRAPLGAFIAAWGGIAMITSAPFDNWWHSAFGLDVQILSPPHFALGLGINGVVLGSTLLVISRMNGAEGAARAKLARILLYFAGLQLVLHMMLVYEYSDAPLMHSATFYRVLTIGVPVILIAFARASGHRWGSTIVAAIYTAFMLVTTWTFPLFPASPKLGPVFTNVTHMLPLGFPVLLIVPAFFLDLTFQKMAGLNRWAQAAIAGSVYLGALIAVHWPFANFMISAHARNWFFGTNNIPYFVPPSLYHLFYEFRDPDAPLSAFMAGMSIAWLSAMISSRIGIALGNVLKRLRR